MSPLHFSYMINVFVANFCVKSPIQWYRMKTRLLFLIKKEVQQFKPSTPAWKQKFNKKMCSCFLSTLWLKILKIVIKTVMICLTCQEINIFFVKFISRLFFLSSFSAHMSLRFYPFFLSSLAPFFFGKSQLLLSILTQNMSRIISLSINPFNIFLLI